MAMSSMRPIGILGGTFDPVHFGHLRLAEVARDQLSLDHIRLIPSGLPPHRKAPSVNAQQRLEMVRLAVSDNSEFVVDDIEVRSSKPSYTVHTLEFLREKWGKRRALVLILGADAFLGLPGWYRWQKLFELAHIAVVTRAPQVSLSSLQECGVPALQALCAGRWCEHAAELSECAAGQVIAFDMPSLAISASLLRNLLMAGASARYLLPDPVLDYIVLNHLYR